MNSSQGDQIGRILDIWANFRHLGEFSTFERILDVERFFYLEQIVLNMGSILNRKRPFDKRWVRLHFGRL
jgi:hypothetical protein